MAKDIFLLNQGMRRDENMWQGVVCPFERIVVDLKIFLLGNIFIRGDNFRDLRVAICTAKNRVNGDQMLIVYDDNAVECKVSKNISNSEH